MEASYNNSSEYYQSTIQILNKTISEKNSEIDMLNKTIEKLKNEKDEVEEELSDSEYEIDDLKDEINNLESKIDELVDDNKTLNIQFGDNLQAHFMLKALDELVNLKQVPLNKIEEYLLNYKK